MNVESLPAKSQTGRLMAVWHKLSFVLLALGMAAGVTWLLLFLAGAFERKTPTAPSPQHDSNAAGQTVEVRLVKRPREETAVGTVRPIHEAALAAKILARVVEVNVRAGQAVAKDEVLIRLDDADLRARLKQAEAAVNTAQAALEQAQADFDRARQLREQRVSTQAEFDAATATLRSAKAELERLRESSREAVVLLDYAVIRSPITGTVVDKRVEVGDTAVPGQVLLSLYDPDRMQLVATVRESLAMTLQVGQKIRVRLDVLNYDCLATISEIVPEAETASHSFTVKVTGPCPPGVYSGMFGRIVLPLSDEELVMVPATAVRRVGQLTMVDVATAGRVVRRDVQLGRRFDDDYEVLAGLKPGEQVLVPGVSTQGR
ncbi:MAG: efflux RND transporter periplasmic adaptor subunit [Pirellulales bacterium]|nr:efflux RND transporter periplasmic adaptor subunit [Pirellulales bacterium]